MGTTDEQLVRPTKDIPIADNSPVSALATGKAGFVFTASSGADKMTLHDVNEGAEVVTLDAKGQAPSSVAVSHDAVKVSFGTTAGAVYVWDMLYPTAMESFRTEDALAAGPITGMAWHPRGHVLAAASEAGVVHIWDMVVGALLFPVPCHDGPIAGITWTGNGRLLLTAGAAGEGAGGTGALRAWSPRDVEFMGSVAADDEDPAQKKGGEFRETSVSWHKAPLTCLDAMVDMSRVAITGATDGSVLLSVMKPEQGCGVFHAMPSHKSRVTDVRFSPLDCPKPLRAASGDSDGTVNLFDMDRRLPMAKFTHGEGKSAIAKLHFNDTADVLFSCGGPSVIAWDARVSPEEAAPIEFGGHGNNVLDFSVANGGASLVTACEDGKLRLFDMRYPAGEAPVMEIGGGDITA